MNFSLSRYFRFLVVFVFFVFFLFPSFSGYEIHALDLSCRTDESQEDCEKRLIEQKRKLEEEVRKLEQGIHREDQKQTSLSEEISRLNSEIQKTSQEIKRKERLISRLKSEISSKEKKIKELNEKLAREKRSLAKILRKRYEIGDTTILEFFLSAKTVSEFYRDLPLFSYIQKSLSRSFKEIDNLKREIYKEKNILEEKKEEHADEKYKLALEKGKVESQKQQRKIALQVSRSREATLAEYKRKKEEEIRKIRSMLIKFRGRGVTKSISFGEAYDYAKLAEKYTGVRAAFIMAIMQQESGFGRNVGGCYLRNDKTGEGVYKTSGNPVKRVMIVSNIPNFKKITSELGMDWKKTPVSCPIYSNGKYYGYGGAMGYTQFIPNTWMGVVDTVKSYLKSPVVSPWNPRDAVMAAGVFLGRLGASKRTYTAEYNAACRYYGACSNYAPSVMARVPKIQKLIDTLEN